MYQLREYQQSLIDRTREAFRSHRRVLMVSPTASGKGVIIAYIGENAAAKGNRTYIVVHRPELVDQLSAALREMEVRHGRIQPGWVASDWPVQVAMVQTLTRRLDKYAPPDFLLFDEAHHIVAPTYQRIAEHWPGAKVGGFTATPLRLDGKGLGRAFDAMVVGPSVRELIDANWLADFDYLAPPQQADLSAVSIRAGDYALDELAAALDKNVITGDAIEHYRTHLDRRPAVVFAVRVDHAEHVAAQARGAGIRAVSVDGSMDKAEREARIKGLANGNTELLTSCDLVGEGLDIPAVSGAILLRKTKSLAMFLQWIGRTLRPKADGSRAVILDHVGCIHEHGMPDAARKWTLDDKRHRDCPPVQTCSTCYRVFETGPNWREGMVCGREPPPPACLLLPPAATEADQASWLPPEVVPGMLQKFTTRPEWANGCDILRASGQEFTALLAHADTYQKLDEIRKIRGYSPYWVRHILKARRGRPVAQ